MADKEQIMADKETVKARVLRDYWPTDDDRDRVTAGTVVDVSKDALIDGLENGVLERIKE